MHRREKPLREPTFPHRRRTPSFSSSLLDSIYRSIDESNGHEGEFGYYREPATMIKKQSNSSINHDAYPQGEKEKISNLRRAIMIENWAQKQSGYGGSAYMNSTSSSSDSSSGGVFSSSEAESYHKEKSRRSSKQCRSEKCTQFEQRINHENKQQQKPKREGGGSDGFTKTKLKALKIYGELKKVKQPISPGGRITSFLNSIFNSNAKKVKICSAGATEDVNFDRKSKSACSSATSVSRSCLSKTPSSSTRGGKYSSTNGMKRSVRFYPVSVIVDEDCRPCGEKCIYEDDPSLKTTPTIQNIVKSSSLKADLKAYAMEKGAGVDRIPRDYWSNYQNKSTHEFDLKGFRDDYVVDDDDEDEDENDDALSYSSSDLFELDHLIGIGRYREELPVYETTNLKTNQAIANGLIL